MLKKNIGKSPSGETLNRIMKSAHYKNGALQNIETTEITLKNVSFAKLLKDFIFPVKLIRPSRTLPNIKSDLYNINDTVPSVVWFGHSSYLLRHNNFNILVDPVLVGNASPLSFAVKPFAGTSLFLPSDIPEIDLLLLTHDHYDHMSFLTLSALKDKIHKIVTPLGLSSTLEYWGFDNKIITEVDWQESVKIDEGLNITSVPSRHFSGRFLKRNQTVWTAYVLDWNKYKIFIGGDSGYDNQFKIIGEKYGPFDIKTKILFPVHWSKFVLSIHAWNEPIKLLRKAAALMDYK